MIFRELDVDIRKFPVASVDARNERVVRHGLFSSQSVKDSVTRDIPRADISQDVVVPGGRFLANQAAKTLLKLLFHPQVFSRNPPPSIYLWTALFLSVVLLGEYIGYVARQTGARSQGLLIGC
jgi:hypothetical protein